MLRSVITMSKDRSFNACNPSTPLAAVVTRQPRRVSDRANASRIAALSSTIKTEYITELAMKDVGVLGYNECRSGVKGAQVLQGRSRLAQRSLGISAPLGPAFALPTLFHVHRRPPRPTARRGHAELCCDGARPVIPITDGRDDALELERVESPRHDERARLLRQAPPLCFGSQRTEQLEIGSVECRRSDEPSDTHARPTFDDHEQVVGMLLVGQRQGADKLPHVVLLLQRAEQLVVGWAQRSQLHGANRDMARRARPTPSGASARWNRPWHRAASSGPPGASPTRDTRPVPSGTPGRLAARPHRRIPAGVVPTGRAGAG